MVLAKTACVASDERQSMRCPGDSPADSRSGTPDRTALSQAWSSSTEASAHERLLPRIWHVSVQKSETESGRQESVSSPARASRSRGQPVPVGRPLPHRSIAADVAYVGKRMERRSPGPHARCGDMRCCGVAGDGACGRVRRARGTCRAFDPSGDGADDCVGRRAARGRGRYAAAPGRGAGNRRGRSSRGGGDRSVHPRHGSRHGGSGRGLERRVGRHWDDVDAGSGLGKTGARGDRQRRVGVHRGDGGTIRTGRRWKRSTKRPPAPTGRTTGTGSPTRP